MKTVLIGLDGATWSILNPLTAQGVMPFLREAVDHGVRGDLMSSIPPISPTGWTSLATGRTPGHHGIFDFIRATERNGHVYFTLYNSRDIRAETVWSMVSRQRMRVTALNYMLTFPPPEVSGYVVPGLVSWRHLRRGVHPPDLHDRLKSLPGLSYKAMAWDFELEKKILQDIGQEDYEAWIRFHIERERQWFDVAQYLMRTDPCDLTAIVFDGIDKIQHVCWRFLDPELAPAPLSSWERRIRQLCVEYFSRLDGYLEQIARMAGPDARVFYVSDHGFGPTREVFRVNVWLHEHAYLTWADPGDLDEAGRQSWARRENSNFATVDWPATTAYARTPSGNGIFIRTAGGAGEPGMPAERYETVRRKLTQELLSVTSPLTGEPVVGRIWTREEAFPGEPGQEAPDLVLELSDHGFISIRNIPPAVAPRPTVAGTHRPEGIFLATGPEVRPGVTIDPLQLTDMTPLLLYSLGLPLQEGLEGRVPFEAFEPEWVSANPARTEEREPGYVPGAAGGQDAEFPAEDDQPVLDRLRMLGYIE